MKKLLILSLSLLSLAGSAQTLEQHIKAQSGKALYSKQASDSVRAVTLQTNNQQAILAIQGGILSSHTSQINSLSATVSSNTAGINSLIGLVNQHTASLSGLAQVARSGSYNDLSDKPTIPVIPALASVALTGNYGDLTGKPSFAPVAFSGFYGDLIGKPTIAALPNLAIVATSGAYGDLTGKPVLLQIGTTATTAAAGDHTHAGLLTAQERTRLASSLTLYNGTGNVAMGLLALGGTASYDIAVPGIVASKPSMVSIELPSSLLGSLAYFYGKVEQDGYVRLYLKAGLALAGGTRAFGVTVIQ
ncbi:hypothetical protein [Tellurirhabdus bombi]|uniref:hypothetical protein n=1 Tax=Tellurirhabdus bombi TaxID=2907205 RepID=UPI001F341B37|nr:hypothetical protein [Tellurirhabdus bombi]